ncbi:MAG: Ig-like domain-containing protein [Candidatus Sulfotelmatobacter sp.]
MKKFRVLMALSCLGLLPACSTKSTTPVPQRTLTSIQITLAQASVADGLTDQLTATGEYSDGTSQNLTASVAWTSSDTNVASITNGSSGPGMVTTHAQGTAIITGSLSGVSSPPLTLTVGAPIVAKLIVSSIGASIARGTTIQYTATDTLTDGTTENATGLVTWTSSNSATVSINVNGVQGLAMGLATGTSTITATVTTSSGTISSPGVILTVTSATLTSISVTPTDLTTNKMPLGTVQQFTASGTFSDNSVQDITGTVAWSASPASVASITTSGLATAKDIGTFTVTATSGSISGSVSAAVSASNLLTITVLPANPIIAQNTTQQFSATGNFNDGSTHNLTAEVTWNSSDKTDAPIGSASGLAKGLAPESGATITATLGTISGTATLEVTNATIVSISVSPTGRTIAPGTELAFTATGTFSDSSTQVLTTDATWTSSNTAVATVGTGGVATAIGPGTANISAAFGGVSESASLTVSSVTLQSIAVSPATAVMAPASTLSYGAIGTYSDGSTQPITNAVTWTSSASNVVSITSYGQATGESAGTATITAQQGSVSGSAAVVVASSTLASIQVSPASATVAEQTGTQFNAVGIFADDTTQNLTGSVTWTSSPASVATVSNASPTKGLATGISAGNATITALFAAQSGAASLTVTDATLSSITITPATADIALDGTQQFTATGNFSDGGTENLTDQVTWTSSDVSVATIKADGLASPASAGTTIITATMNGVHGTATLTVN